VTCKRCGTVFCDDMESDAYWLSCSRRRHCSKACQKREQPGNRRRRRELNQAPRRVRRQVALLRERDGDDCWLCHLPIDFTVEDINDPMRYSRDHVVPRAAGGDRGTGNMKLAHRKCNSSRSPGAGA
jgi:hypothetical protein